MSTNQFALAIWYPCYFSNNLNVWKLCSTIAKKCEEAEASNSGNFAWWNEQINGRIGDPISIAKGNIWPHDPVQATKFASEAGVVVRHQIQILTHWKHYKKPSGVVHYRNFVDRLTVCMGILSWHSTLLWATLTDLLFIHTTSVVKARHWQGSPTNTRSLLECIAVWGMGGTL